MSAAQFDYRAPDAMAMPVAPLEPAAFDFSRFEAYAAEADARYAAFLRQPEGIAVWQRVRVGEVFRDQCRDMKTSLHWQLGGLSRAMDYLTDAPAYLEPWYGIGTTAAAFGAEYRWLPGQAPVVEPRYASTDGLPELLQRPIQDAPILRYTLETIEYFLDQTRGRVPVSWCDLQSPLNVIGGLVDIGQFLILLLDDLSRARQILSALADEVIRFTKVQSELIGPALARPGHGFASSRAGTGIGLSTDNLIMVAPALYALACADHTARIGEEFGGAAIHSCGNWARWLPAVKAIRNLVMVDGAFSPQTDPACNECEPFRDELAGTGIILQARIVGGPEEVLPRVKRVWKRGMRLIVVTHLQDPGVQRELYREIHQICG
jgi:hypothetical protein